MVRYIDQVFHMVQYKYVLTWPSVSDGPMQCLLDQVFHMVQYIVQVFHMVQYIDQVFHMVQFKYVFTLYLLRNITLYNSPNLITIL